MSSKVPIDVPFTVREIAQMAKPEGAELRPKDTENMRRRLMRWHREYDETILVKVGGRWQCTIASLRRAWPSFGEKFAEQTDLDDLGEKFTKHGTRLRSCEIGLQNVRAQLNSLSRAFQSHVATLHNETPLAAEASAHGVRVERA